jgi:hypothetical protein
VSMRLPFTIDDFFVFHYQWKNIDKQRMGQRFINMYVKEPWPELFYCNSEKECKEMIVSHLNNCGYFHSLPHPLVKS